MPANKTNSEFRQLLTGLIDGQLDVPDLRRFEELLSASPERQKFYDEFMALHAMLLWRAGPPISPVGSDEIDQLTELRFQAGDAPALPPPGFIGAAWQGATGFFAGNEFALPYTVAVLFIGVAMLFGSMVHISRNTRIVENDPAQAGPAPMDDGKTLLVGQITDMNDCRWADSETSTIVGAHVPLKRKYSLSSGLLEITYRSGARVILEGPCEYTVDSCKGGFLHVGKLVARVEKRGERREGRGGKKVAGAKQQAANSQSLIPNPQSLFCITTPTALVTDLGTEFGVEVSENGDTTSHVFCGSVRVRAICDGRQDEVVLRADELARVEKGKDDDLHLLVGAEAGKPPEFTRWIYEPPTQLDLLDIVAGGNGLGHHRERGIDQTTGMEDPSFIANRRVGDRRYRPVAWHKLIDGVFVPDGSAGPVQLDSVGHAFNGFPKTTGIAWGSIWSRTAEIKPERRANDEKYWVYAMDGDEQFMPARCGLLGFCPNTGITFDLEAIRRLHPGAVPSRFHAIAGMADLRRVCPEADGMFDLWFFVDGRLKLKREKLRLKDGTFNVNVPLGPNDRFFTLVATDGGNHYRWDWVVLGDPVFQVVSTDSEQSADNPLKQDQQNSPSTRPRIKRRTNP